MPRQPLYPHVPKSRNTAPRVPSYPPDITLRFLPDSPEFLAESITCTGCREKLDRVFQQAIARAKGGK